MDTTPTLTGACDEHSRWVVVSTMFLVGEPTTSGDVSVVECRVSVHIATTSLPPCLPRPSLQCHKQQRR